MDINNLEVGNEGRNRGVREAATVLSMLSCVGAPLLSKLLFRSNENFGLSIGWLHVSRPNIYVQLR